MSDYQITDEDIDGMVHFLEVYRPKQADRDHAILFLEYLKSGFENIARNNPDDIETLYEQFEKSLDNHRSDTQQD
jgi:hypothetical protein